MNIYLVYGLLCILFHPHSFTNFTEFLQLYFVAGVFKNFEKDGEFFCFVGQSTQAVTGMYNLNRASQISFQGEDILQRARIFSYEFLRQREAESMLRDKWIIAKDLAGEVIQPIHSII
jgi:hypothetical protein